jgi:hypothetical protein
MNPESELIRLVAGKVFADLLLCIQCFTLKGGMVNFPLGWRSM